MLSIWPIAPHRDTSNTTQPKPPQAVPTSPGPCVLATTRLRRTPHHIAHSALCDARTSCCAHPSSLPHNREHAPLTSPLCSSLANTGHPCACAIQHRQHHTPKAPTSRPHVPRSMRTRNNSASSNTQPHRSQRPIARLPSHPPPIDVALVRVVVIANLGASDIFHDRVSRVQVHTPPHTFAPCTGDTL